jgi:hypothetical protein
MGAKADGKVRYVRITRGEALGAQLAQTATAAALETLRIGGYRPTQEQLADLARRVTREALAAGILIVECGADFADEEFDSAAEVTAHAAVREILGPPPRMN